jgi:hypothetical protein
MSLLIPEYPNPFQATPASNAYGWISTLALDFTTPIPSGRVALNVHADTAAALAGAQSIDQPAFVLGVDGFPGFGELMHDPEFAQAFAVVRSKLYAAIGRQPLFAGAVEVP